MYKRTWMDSVLGGKNTHSSRSKSSATWKAWCGRTVADDFQSAPVLWLNPDKDTVHLARHIPASFKDLQRSNLVVISTVTFSASLATISFARNMSFRANCHLVPQRHSYTPFFWHALTIVFHHCRLAEVQNVSASVCSPLLQLLASFWMNSYISDYMRDALHWLPVQERIKFKVILLGHALLVTTTPTYIREPMFYS